MNIVFLDCTQNYGYQFSAANTKVELMARGLRKQGATITILNGVSGMAGISSRDVKQDKETGKVITYPFKGRFLGFLENKTLLKQDLNEIYKGGEQNIVILSNVDIHLYSLYLKVAHKCGYKVVAISHEWLPTIKRRFWIQNRLGKIYADSFGKSVEGILPISEYIIKRIKKFGKPYMKVPILADFCNIPCKDRTHDGGLVYCGYALYFRVIEFMLQSYASYTGQSKKPMPLTLVLSGSDTAITRVAEKIRELKLESHTSICTRLPYTGLIALYESAQGLIIPLDPNHEQDHARFSQKIAEYLSSGSPIITNGVGEVSYYFTHGRDAVICDYSIEGFKQAFEWIESHPEEAKRIGVGGFETGKREFDYRTKGKELFQFLDRL